MEKIFVTIPSSVEHRATPALHQHIQVALFSADTSRFVLPGPLQLHTLPHHASRLSLCFKNKKLFILLGLHVLPACTPHAGLETSRGLQIPRNWNYRWL